MNEGVVLSCIIGINSTFSTDEINIILMSINYI